LRFKKTKWMAQTPAKFPCMKASEMKKINNAASAAKLRAARHHKTSHENGYIFPLMFNTIKMNTLNDF